MKKIQKKKALEFCREVDWDISYERLYHYLASRGWKIVLVGNGSQAEGILDTIGKRQYVKEHGAFTYQNSEFKLVFVDKKLTLYGKRNILVHEIGHILLGHVTVDTLLGQDPFLEQEAKEFSDFVFTRKSERDRIKKYLRYAPVALVCCGAIIIASSLWLNRDTKDNMQPPAPTVSATVQTPAPLEPSQTTEPTATPEPADEQKIVYVTKTGKKYHLPDCQYVKYKDYLKEMTIKEALDAGLQPCKVCDPNEKE